MTTPPNRPHDTGEAREGFDLRNPMCRRNFRLRFRERWRSLSWWRMVFGDTVRRRSPGLLDNPESTVGVRGAWSEARADFRREAYEAYAADIGRPPMTKEEKREAVARHGAQWMKERIEEGLRDRGVAAAKCEEHKSPYAGLIVGDPVPCDVCGEPAMWREPVQAVL